MNILDNYSLALLPFILLLGLRPAAEPSAPAEKDFLYDSYEGTSPNITYYSLRGDFDQNRSFSLEIAQHNTNWHIKFAYGNDAASVIAIPVKRYAPLNFERVIVVTKSPSPNDTHILVVVPFGEPHRDCFANGDQVFDHVELEFDSEKLVASEERYFEKCEEEHRPLRREAPLEG